MERLGWWVKVQAEREIVDISCSLYRSNETAEHEILDK